ncbi:MAG: UPF0158 family protein [bacterium]|nr:UPF0158 family protein [bacterium]
MTDLKQIKEAFSSTHKDRIYILDKKTLQIIEVSNEDEEDYQLEIAQKVQKSPDRYLNIPKRSAGSSYNDMVEFIHTKISNKGLQTKLEKAIATEKAAFARFKDILSVEDPETLKTWYVFLDKKVEEELISFLRENNVNI